MTVADAPKTAPRRQDGNFLVGDLRHFQNDPVAYFPETGKQNPVMRFRMAHLDNVLVTDAELAKEVLQTRNKNYIKDPRLNKILEEGTDKVLFTTDGDEWLWRRRLMQPAFHRKQIAQFCTAIVEEAQKMVDGWQDGQTFDAEEAMKLVTMMVIGKTMFNVDMAGDSAELHHAYDQVGTLLAKRITTPLSLPRWMPTADNRGLTNAQATIEDALTTIINDRKQSQEPHNDLLEMLLTMTDTSDGFTQNQLMYEMSSIVFAGHETTAVTLTWFLYALTQNPDVEAKVYEEIDRVLGKRTPTMDDLANLPYLNQTLNETMRMYPAARATTREAVADDVLGGYEIKAGDRMFINIIGIHMDERYWDEPEKFDPDRFSDERSEDRHKWAFLPFLNGPRKCIGEPLSRAEMQLIAAIMLQNFTFRLPAGAKVEQEVRFVLHPKGGLDVIASAR